MSLTAAEVWARLPVEWRVFLRAWDIAKNLKLGGDPETISERLAKARDAGKWTGIKGCRILDGIDPGHCDRALKFPTKDK